MKNKLFLLANLLLVLCLSSCEIESSECESEYTTTGKEMFLHTEAHVVSWVGRFDDALKLDTYMNTPDSLKETIRQLYFTSFGIGHSKPNSWSVLLNADTICTVVTDSKSIHTVGAIWSFKMGNANEFSTISCIAPNKWQIKVVEVSSYHWLDNADFEVVCTDVAAPPAFSDSHFEISGQGNMTTGSSYGQRVNIKYKTTDNLVHDPSTFMFSSGGFEIEAFDLDKDKKELATGEYLKAMGDDRWVQITSRGRTQIYSDLYYYQYY